MANEHSQIVPSMQPTAKVADFKFWCQKVLPLVYDDSLSYYEVLNKMVVYLNQVIDNINADIDNVEELEDDFLLLQTYVNNFFDDIDQLVTYAERAEAAETAALSSAASAAESASNSATSASNSASSASSSATSALSAMDAKDAAVAAKTAAETALSNAQTAATNAASSATAASGSATNAAASATAASGSATNAAASATAAQQSFTLADAARTAAQTAATNAANSADVAAAYATGYFVEETLANQAVAIFTDGADNVPVKSLVTDIQTVQALGTPSPENPLAITGWTECNIVRASKNLIVANGADTTTKSGVTFTKNSDGSWAANGTASATATCFIGSIFVKSGNIIILSGCPSGGGINTFRLDGRTPNGTVVEGLYSTTDSSELEYTVQYDRRIDIYIRIASGYTVNNLVFYPMIRFSTEEKEPFVNNGELVNISWQTEAGTVYGGTLNVTTGVLTVDRAKVELSSANAISDWQTFAGAVGYNSSSGQFPYADYAKPIVCNKLATIPPTETLQYGKCKYAWTSFYFWFNDGAFTDYADAQAKVDAANIECVYYLTTPLTYQLTAQQITTLLGKNNILGDTGNINTLTYRADTKLYIDKKIAEATA